MLAVLQPKDGSTPSGGPVTMHAFFDDNEASLQENGTHPFGRCFHVGRDGTPSGQVPTARLGCEGHNKVPIYYFRDSTEYSDAGFAGGNSELGSEDWSQPNQFRRMFIVGLEGTELVTTEFDSSAGIYSTGDYLRAPEANPEADDRESDIRQKAGVLTKEGADPYTSTIVGIVSPGVEPSESRRSASLENCYSAKVISFYTTYRPPLLPPQKNASEQQAGPTHEQSVLRELQAELRQMQNEVQELRSQQLGAEPRTGAE